MKAKYAVICIIVVIISAATLVFISEHNNSNELIEETTQETTETILETSIPRVAVAEEFPESSSDSEETFVEETDVEVNVKIETEDYISSMTIDELIDAVLQGSFGNGEERKIALGDRFDEVQQAIDELCSHITPKIASNNNIQESLAYAEIPDQPIVFDSSDDVFELGLDRYGISHLDTERTLKLITYEGYGESMLSYYVACCCWVRATEDYWGYGNLYSAFGEIDTQYGTWMDSLGIADYAYDYLLMCYQDPTYCKYCNGCTIPNDYIYTERGIYCWN